MLHANQLREIAKDIAHDSFDALAALELAINLLTPEQAEQLLEAWEEHGIGTTGAV